MAAEIGFVYLLSHPDMPEVYKIGCTERSPHQRARELSGSTSVPQEFNVLCYVEVENHRDVERAFHQWFSRERISPGREFFRVDSLCWIASHFFFLPVRFAFSNVKLLSELRDLDCSWDDLTDPWEPKERVDLSEALANQAIEIAKAASA